MSEIPRDSPLAEVDTFLAGNSIFSRAFYHFGRWLVVGVVRLLTRVSVVGKDNVPRSGAFVLAPVHRSNFDTPLAAAVTRRRLRFMGKDSLWKVPVVKSVLSALGGFPVTRGTADREALSRCIAVLQSGEPMVLFPEGTRQSGPIVESLFDGASYIAVKAGVPIVPVGIGGSENVMRKGSKMIRPHKCYVVVGKPITVDVDENGRAPRSAVRDVTARLQSELQRLFDEAQVLAGTPNVVSGGKSPDATQR